MICSTDLDLLQSSGEFSCAICRTGVDSNRIMYNGRMHWVYSKCKGLKHLKRTQTTGTLDVKELPGPQIEDHRRGFRLTVVSDKLGQ